MRVEDSTVIDNPESNPEIVEEQNTQIQNRKMTVPPLSLPKVSDRRRTRRQTELYELEIMLKQRKQRPEALCCCIISYIDEEPTPYFQGFEFVSPEDLYLHQTTVLRQNIYCNIFSFSHLHQRVVLQRAVDGEIFSEDAAAIINIEENKLYKLDVSEKCSYKHHDLRRFSTSGRIWKHLCTPSGLYSTLKKCILLSYYVDQVDIKTVSCEKHLYRKIYP